MATELKQPEFALNSKGLSALEVGFHFTQAQADYFQRLAQYFANALTYEQVREGEELIRRQIRGGR